MLKHWPKMKPPTKRKTAALLPAHLPLAAPHPTTATIQRALPGCPSQVSLRAAPAWLPWVPSCSVAVLCRLELWLKIRKTHPRPQDSAWHNLGCLLLPYWHFGVRACYARRAESGQSGRSHAADRLRFNRLRQRRSARGPIGRSGRPRRQHPERKQQHVGQPEQKHRKRKQHPKRLRQ